jgi:hypothetical protein
MPVTSQGAVISEESMFKKNLEFLNIFFSKSAISQK